MSHKRMRLGLVIFRSNCYKVIGPVGSLALQEGSEVYCYHDYGQERFRGGKFREFPNLNTCPFQNQEDIRLRRFRNALELSEMLERDNLDHIISTRSRSQFGLDATRCLPWWIVQFGVDLLKSDSLPEDLKHDNLILRGPQFWRNYETRLRDAGMPIPDGPPEDRIAGYPAFDLSLGVSEKTLYDSFATSIDKPAVLFLAMQNGVYTRMPRLLPKIWARGLYQNTEKSRWQWLERILGRVAGTLSGMPLADERDLLLAIRSFCDRNGANLWIKGRFKEPLPDWYEDIADEVWYDETYVPATTHELMKAASLCISFESMANFEAAYYGTYSLNLELMNLFEDYPLFKSLFGDDFDGVFNAPGFSQSWSLARLLKELPGAKLEDFALNQEVASAIVERYEGPNPGNGAARVLEILRTCTTGSKNSEEGTIVR